MSKQKQVELGVEGMTCVSCAQHVEKALAAVRGVKEVNVPGWQSAQASVIVEGDVSPEALATAISKAGYQVTSDERIEIESVNGAGSDFDLLVIGGGSGGFAAAIAASDLGKRVGMINAGTIGGTCVNVGCVPSKALIRAAEAWHKAGNHPFNGVGTAQGKLDWATVRAEKDALVGDLRQAKYVDVLSAYPDITYIEGWAEFQEDGSLRVGEQVYRASRYVIATGAQARVLPMPGVEEVQPLNSTTLMELEELPQSLIILGGRVIALELGQMMARFGVDVTLLQRSTSLVPDLEPEIGQAIRSYMEEEGITVVTGVQVEELSRDEDSRIVKASVNGGDTQEFRAEHIMLALGRQPNTNGMGLEQVGVELDSSGAIIVNEYMQTSNSTIFASGDVTTNPEFVYVAAAGGNRAANNALTGTQKALDLSAMPAVIFTDPQIATVGLTEAQAAREYEVLTSTIELKHVARAQAARDIRGLIKLVAEAETGRLLGAHIVAAEAGEVIQTATLAVKFGLTIDDLKETLFPYLTQVEGLKLAALAFDKDPAMLSCCAV